MAERVRFELTVLAYTRVPGVHLKPLGHLSGKFPANGRDMHWHFLNEEVPFDN